MHVIKSMYVWHSSTAQCSYGAIEEWVHFIYCYSFVRVYISDVAEEVLNKCMVSDPKTKDPGASAYTVIMNYEFLEDFSMQKRM